MTAPTQPRPGSVAPRRHSLLDVITVTADAAPGDWSRGPTVSEYLDRAGATIVTDICEPSYPLPALDDVPLGDEVRPFAIVSYARVPTRCTTEAELRAAIAPQLPRTTEYRLAKYLWAGGGVVPDEPHVMHADITEITRTGNPNTDLATALTTAYSQAGYLRPVALLGIETALHLAVGLNNVDLKYVVSPAFPTNAIAIVDDNITATLSPVEVTTSTQIDVNRIQLEATQIALLEFDITKAVRVAA